MDKFRSWWIELNDVYRDRLESTWALSRTFEKIFDLSRYLGKLSIMWVFENVSDLGGLLRSATFW